MVNNIVTLQSASTILFNIVLCIYRDTFHPFDFISVVDFKVVILFAEQI